MFDTYFSTICMLTVEIKVVNFVAEHALLSKIGVWPWVQK